MKQHFYDGRDLELALPTQYSAELVILSFLIACLAAYAAVSIAARIRAAERQVVGRVWLLAGAVTFGEGVWAMHFLGMLALKVSVPVGYDVMVTALSAVPVIVAAGVWLQTIGRNRIRKMALFGAGTLLGAGIGAMHYSGMFAMHGLGQHLVMLFEPTLFVVSLIAGIALANVAVFLQLAVDPLQRGTPGAKFGIALILGCAVSGMHYTAMSATYFFAGPAAPYEGSHALDPRALAFWVAFASVMITTAAIFLTVVDSRLQAAARKEAVSRFRMREAIESIADGFSLYDMDDRLVECNERYRELMDSGQGIVPGMSFEAVIRNAAETGLILDAEGRVDEWVAERLARHRAPREHFVEHFRGDRWIRVSERRVWKTGTVAIRTDITELKRTEIELSKAMDEAQRARAAAEEASRAKSAFLANMSHELRTPMNAIIGYSEMLLEDVHDAGLGTYVPDLEKIRSAGKHLLALISEILDLSKIEAGKMDLYLEAIDLLAVIKDVTSTIKPLVDKNRNELVVDHPERLPTMTADLTKLRQGLFNLLSNACKFTENGIISFQVETEHSEGSDWICFRVSDTGIGMAPDQVTRIFDAFTQADNSTTRRYGGTGLGLTITKRFCLMMGGDVVVHSEAGKGAKFEIRLPLDVSLSVAAVMTSPETEVDAPDLPPSQTQAASPAVPLSRTPDGSDGLPDMAAG